MNYNKFNQVSSSSWTQDAVKQWKECDVLDKLQGAFSNRLLAFDWLSSRPIGIKLKTRQS